MEGCNWCFTLNNYTSEDEDLLKSFFNEYCRYMVYGKEIGSKEHTPHLQGYIQLKKKLRMLSLKKKIGINTIHLELQRAKNSEDARNYCLKDGDIVEYGEFLKFGSPKAKKDNLRQQIINCESWNDVLKLIQTKPGYLNYAKEVWKIKQYEENKKLVPFLGKFYPWQQWLFDMTQQRNDRDIYIICDPAGGKGKSYFCGVMEDSFGALCIQPQKANDIRYLYNGEEIVLFDIPRNNKYNCYGVIEEIKDGYVVSGKYEGKIIRQKNPVFVGIFTNSRYGEEIANKYSQHKIVLVYFKSDIEEVKSDEDMIDDYKRSIKYRHVIIDDNNKEELIICNMTDLLNQLNIK